MNFNKRAQTYIFFSISFILLACNHKKNIDVSHIVLNIPIERFDIDLNTISQQNLPLTTQKLQQKYGRFYEDYMEKMIGIGSVRDTNYYSNLKTILQNKDYLELKSSVNAKFPSLSKTQNELTDAFKHIRYYYPEQKLPRLISFISGFAFQTPVGDDYIGIGLDMFLGADSKFYPALRQSIPQYISRRFTPDNITPRVLEAFIREDMFPEEDKNRSLISKMIYNGKILYMMDEIMPNIADTLKIGYTDKQLQWCKKNEGDIWAYFLQNDLLFNTDYLKIQKFLAEAPFTPGIGENSESAPKLGVWTGWQIVRKYMDKNPDITLQELMKDTDYQKILTASKYKPR
ncbi:MAG: gliding motility lipoprotein GldB [Daejeonella sp.]